MNTKGVKINREIINTQKLPTADWRWSYATESRLLVNKKKGKEKETQLKRRKKKNEINGISKHAIFLTLPSRFSSSSCCCNAWVSVLGSVGDKKAVRLIVKLVMSLEAVHLMCAYAAHHSRAAQVWEWFSLWHSDKAVCRFRSGTLETVWSVSSDD